MSSRMSKDTSPRKRRRATWRARGPASPDVLYHDVQATEVSNLVKALGELLSCRQAGKNHYQGIFAELYLRFGVSSYKLTRQEQYAGVLDERQRSSGD